MVGLCVDWWVDEWGSYQITKNLIYFGLIQVNQFYLKTYDLCRHPHLWVGV